VPTVSIDPDSSTCLSTARANSEAARPASFLLKRIYIYKALEFVH